MDSLLSKFATEVKGTICGFDRIVFKGIIRPIVHSGGMQSFLLSHKILNKNFKSWAMGTSQMIVDAAEEFSLKECGHKISYIPSINIRKEELAHKRQEECGIESGLIGVWSCVESCHTFRSVFNPESTYPSLKPVASRCKHLYFYFDDPTYGFMSVRLQTWAPYEIQIALNGREWLRRQLDAQGCSYHVEGNKFLHIDDYEIAQRLLDDQTRVDFKEVLKGFLPSVFPRMSDILGPHLSYYWTFWQSEVAKDYLFADSASLVELMEDFELHALITGRGERILKYFGSPCRSDGLPRKGQDPEIITRMSTWYDGLRVKHWCDKNSVKLYNELNVLRFEMWMNDPRRFKVHRHTEGQDKSESKKYLPMRKGIADTTARFDVSRNVINNFTEHMAAVEEKTRLGVVIGPVIFPLTSKGRRYRALDAFGKDRELLCAVADPAGDVSAITNKQLQKSLEATPWAKGMSGKRLSGRISRHLRLLREHGLIRKLPNQRKYTLTDKGRKLTCALECALETSVIDLLRLAA